MPTGTTATEGTPARLSVTLRCSAASSRRVRVRFSPSFRPGAEHDLRVDIDPVVGQFADLRQNGGRLAAAEEHSAEVGIGGMHGDIERGEPLFQNARPLLVGEVGERDIVAVHEGEAEIVVHQVERFAHLFGLLVDEAEDALVLAGVDLVAQIELEVQSGVLIQPFAQGERQRLPVALDIQFQAGRAGVKAVVQNVDDARRSLTCRSRSPTRTPAFAAGLSASTSDTINALTFLRKISDIVTYCTLRPLTIANVPRPDSVSPSFMAESGISLPTTSRPFPG